MQSDEFDVGSEGDAQDQARMQRREAFFAALGPLPLAEQASSALSECTKMVEARLKSEPPRGLEDDAASAWDEAALVITADGHPMRDVVVQELGGLADEHWRGCLSPNVVQFGFMWSRTRQPSMGIFGTALTQSSSTPFVVGPAAWMKPSTGLSGG